ncbi:MAG: CapA family protein [Prevotella sp.]|nr:CapA family protein [Prevotella sp.]
MKILICGDFTTCGRGQEAVNEKTALSPEVVNIVKSADVSIVNLEAPVADVSDKKLDKHGPNLRTDASTVTYLKECGFTHVTLANNHFYDYCDAGVEKTLAVLSRNVLGYVGAGRTPEDFRRPLDLGDVVVLNYCEHEFSVHEPMGCNPLNPIQAYYDITKAKNEGKRAIVIVHGGHEGYNLPSPRMVELYRYFIDCGASIVLNHHQHCYSGWEEYHNGKIFYGLGNFFFDDFRPVRQRNIIWNSGYMVMVETDSLDSEVYPYTQCLEEATVEVLRPDEKSRFDSTIKVLNAIIADETLLNDNFTEFCDKGKNYRLTQFAPYSNRLLQIMCRRGLLPKFLGSKRLSELENVIKCEAHRDVILNIMRNNEVSKSYYK